MWPETVRKTDLRIDYYRGSGKGGQNRNKRDTACRITHIPTGIVSTAEDERTQGRNRALAFRRLCARLVPMMRAAVQTTHDKKTDTIRTYHEKRNEVKDHRVKDKTWRLDDILDGNLDEMFVYLRSRTD